MTEPMPEGSRALVDQAVDEAAQTLFGAADVPIARRGELLAALQGPAVRSVLELRLEQMVKHGHTLEGDLDLPIGWLANDARIRLQSALDVINAGPERRNLPVARRRVATAAALCLAALDVLDATINAEG
ncbi:MAG TPA: hypothetical protein VM265_07995 [Sphingomicrobium sp.]|nr:hypothetical protein [Sphingomicrobium sp.]